MAQWIVLIGKKKTKYHSYQGEIMPLLPNLIAREFHVDAPNVKGLTDLKEFHISSDTVYRSPMVDCFDGLLASWSIGMSPGTELVNSMLDAAISPLNPENNQSFILMGSVLSVVWMAQADENGWVDKIHAKKRMFLR